MKRLVFAVTLSLQTLCLVHAQSDGPAFETATVKASAGILLSDRRWA